MSTLGPTERPNLTRAMMRMKNLRYEMEEICRSFKLAMTGNDYLLDKAVSQSLDLFVMTGCHDIVFLALKLACHASKPDLVMKIFDAVFEAAGDFGLLFFGIVFGPGAVTSNDMEEYQWYLKAAAKKTYDSVPLVDVPYQGFTFAAHAAALARTTVLLMLLRNGADPVKATLLLQPSLKTNKSWDAVLRLVLRALPNPSPSLLSVEPTLAMVPKLKHMSKIAVRSLLASAGALPEGIYELEIPFELKQYLDFLTDF